MMLWQSTQDYFGMLSLRNLTFHICGSHQWMGACRRNHNHGGGQFKIGWNGLFFLLELDH